MRVTFICSALEPGRDGVGDYTRLLAESLRQQGHATQLIALNDRHTSLTALADEQGAAEAGESRLSACRPWSERVVSAADSIAAFRPDWVSVQFVSFGFDDRGLVWGLGPRLRRVIGNVATHVMFHELWGGDARGASPRERLEGLVRRQLVLRAIRQLRPAVVHTNTSLYVALLGQRGIRAARLPLFCNVPVTLPDDTTWLENAFDRAGVQITGSARPQHWLFGLFGTLHPQWQPEPLFSRIRAAARAHRKVPVIVAAGRLGAAGERLWSSLQQSCDGLTFVSLGEQPARRISQALQSLDFGITSSPLALIGKSSAAATMLGHGLPVIVNRDDISFPFEFTAPECHHPSLIRLDDAFSDRLGTTVPGIPDDPRHHVARLLTASLESAC